MPLDFLATEPDPIDEVGVVYSAAADVSGWWGWTWRWCSLALV